MSDTRIDTRGLTSEEVTLALRFLSAEDRITRHNHLIELLELQIAAMRERVGDLVLMRNAAIDEANRMLDALEAIEHERDLKVVIGYGEEPRG